MPKGEVRVDYTLCMACGCCVQACPFGCLELAKVGLDAYNKEYPQHVDGHQCTACGQCATACPVDCITVLKFDKVESPVL